MTRRNLQYRYEKGKQIITFLAAVVCLLGFFLDAITYHAIYSNIQIWLQVISVFVFISSVFYFAKNPKRNYPISFALISYGVICNIILTSTILYTFISFQNFTEANILSRNIFFIVLLIILTGFILGRKHLFIQGLLLISLLLYFIFIKKNVFFIQNAAVYIVTSIGFIYVLYFLVGVVNELIKGLEESNILTNKLKETEAKKNRSQLKYQNTLLHLAKDQSLFKGDLDSLFRKICLLVSNDLGTSRVSIWAMEENDAMIVRKHLCELTGGNDDKVCLTRKDFPLYFKALDEGPFILALDAAEHPATSELKEVYLKPLAIRSILDCPIVIDGKPIGVIRCENQLVKKDWGTEEVTFIQAMAENISLCYKNLKINTLLEQIRQRNNELVEKTNEIETMNEELMSVNETLEAAVIKRTSELETQNKQLTEYAFINSHILRAPLARILGLCYLITTEATSLKDKQLMEALKISSEELDLIIRKISDLLYDGNNLSRADIQSIIERNIQELK